MRAWLLRSLDGLDKLELAEVARPAPAAGEVLLAVSHAALNPADAFLAARQYPAKPPLPHILGRDAIGTVADVGPGIADWRIGDKAVVLRSEIGVSRWGTFAEFVAVPAESLVRPPQGWSDQQCAGAPLVCMTAYQALSMWADLPANAIVLVTGASGGVGIATVQLARAMGYRALAASRGPARREALLELGATWVSDPDQHEWQHRVKELLGDERVNLVVDNVAGTILPGAIDTLANHGRVSVVGRSAGPVPDFNTGTLFFRRIKIGGVAVGAYSAAESRQAWAQCVSLLERTGARPIIDQVFPFEQLPEAFRRLGGTHFGKVLLNVNA